MHTAVKCVLVLAWALLAAGGVPVAEAQSWPQRTVRLVLPFGAGSATDVTARLLAERLQARWNHPVVVENRPGGDGLVSIGSVVSSKDDHVLFFSPTSVFIVHPYQHANLPYDPEQDLVPIVRISKSLLVLAAPATLPARDLKEFSALVKANPGKFNYGMTPGFTEFVFEGFLREQGLVMSKVPYRDIVQAPIDLGENRIQILGVSHTVAVGQVNAGKVKLLAVADRKRSALAPDVPSVVESGFPSLESVSLIGAFGQRGMSLDLRKRIAADFLDIVADTAIADKIRAAAQEVETDGPEAFAATIAQVRVRVDEIARLVGRKK
jgi:tripartite-type tricarboxylate transporter receptor subunit TctC